MRRLVLSRWHRRCGIHWKSQSQPRGSGLQWSTGRLSDRQRRASFHFVQTVSTPGTSAPGRSARREHRARAAARGRQGNQRKDHAELGAFVQPGRHRLRHLRGNSRRLPEPRSQDVSCGGSAVPDLRRGSRQHLLPGRAAHVRLRRRLRIQQQWPADPGTFGVLSAGRRQLQLSYRVASTTRCNEPGKSSNRLFAKPASRNICSYSANV